ncbi:DNA topoisomerase III [Lysinibacillus pakistanensis]|uniref:DNA topoisomerase n=1 Tax=Lysinibacillus pakistanensis TaxID=759811 RepID=A0AAX3X0P2_9BACI|nr:DNA topoisomerase III [Lysinibacillus pakistanensis]MDM5233259.1 DNA topoisomerase III [Lysinibacillus pakistanensis]WHY48737.1 DNA topoisomerase III [Lysinibacillus pakistanensis]WHY53750.1 DNA topoisomerase III [Lysinibacillus pakistanensis]
MKIVIAEKPDQAVKLAAPFSYTKKSGYLEVKPNVYFPNGALITWAIGHLCELKAPEEYNSTWKKWTLETLPIIPDRFEYKVTKSKYKQFNVIKNLVKRPDIQEIIIGGDAGREGELIIRTILRVCGVKKPMKRLWISSLTENAVKKGFSNLLPEEKTRDIYFEALSRSCADWLIGINTSRLYTVLLKKNGIKDVFSIGRVQTPTLALIVKREQEIANFKPEPFLEVEADFNFEGKILKAKWHKNNISRVQEEKQAIAIANFCINKSVEISSIKKETKEYAPPLLFNLSALQATANKAYKFSPQYTLDILQKLYLKGLVSYPRSDSQYLTNEEAKTLPNILENLSKIDKYKNLLPPPTNSIMNNKRYVNEKKVTDHHAIIITEQYPNFSKLKAEEEKIYDLVVRQVIAAHYNNAVFSYTTIHSLVDKRAEFISKGKVQIEEGWRKVIYHSKDNSSTDEDELLPLLSENELGIVAKTKVKKGETQPPTRYSEGNLITLMKTAGKHLEDNELEKILSKTEGLGTEATRAGIIGTLKDRNYIEIKKNQVFVTTKGMLLIEALGESILTSPLMTAKWEQRLSEIGEGNASPKVFMEQVKKLAYKLITDANEREKEWAFDQNEVDKITENNPYNKKYKKVKKVVGKCMLCGGSIIDHGTFYGCSNYKTVNCKFSISKKILSKTISQANLKKLLATGETDLIKGFKKGEKTFNAHLTWDIKMHKINFKFP